MRTRKIVVASRKGGTGKTTCTTHLAVEAGRAGSGPVAVIDTDDQANLSDWWNVRDAEHPQFARVTLDTLTEHMATLTKLGINLAIIDTPSVMTSTIGKAIDVADLVIIPTRPSPNDLRSIGIVVDAVEALGKPFFFVLNCAKEGTLIESQTIRALAQHGKVAPVVLHDRIDFATSMTDGRTAGELNSDSRSAREIAELWKYVDSQLRKYAKD